MMHLTLFQHVLSDSWEKCELHTYNGKQVTKEYITYWVLFSNNGQFFILRRSDLQWIWHRWKVFELRKKKKFFDIPLTSSNTFLVLTNFCYKHFFTNFVPLSQVSIAILVSIYLYIHPGINVMILKIFSPTKPAKNWRFLIKNTAEFYKQWIITLVFKKDANFFTDNWWKSHKIVIITSTPGRPH
jgi:hypothetical protein